MAPMKICVVTDAWHPQINGVVTTLGRTVATLQGWGHKVETITPDRFATLPCPTYPEIRLSLVWRPTIERMLNHFAPDAVHIATEGPLGWAARSACCRQGLGFTTSYHTRFPEYIRMRLPLSLRLSYRVVRRFHGAAVRTMVAPTLLDEMVGRGFQNLSVWSRGVDTELFRPGAKTFFDLPRPIFLSMGRVAVEKNLPAFLDLDLPGSKVVVGAGPALVELRKRYPDVLFTGLKRGQELARHLAAADCFVFPSLTDTFGLVLLEAMACGVPVAAFPVTGPKYVVNNGVSGRVDPDLKRAALQALELDPQQCRRQALEYSWEHCTDQFYNNLAFQSN